LMVIRDEKLHLEAGFDCWDRYLKERVGNEFGIEMRQAQKFIACAQIRPKLPDISRSQLRENGEAVEWGIEAVYEFGRLAPKEERHKGRYDFGRLRKHDVEQVAKKVIDHCKEEGVKLTAPVVRRFVDEELGVNRVAQARESNRRRREQEAEAEARREEEEHPDLEQYLNELIRKLDRDAEHLKEVEEDVWKQWRAGHLGLVMRLTAACKALTDLLGRE